MNWKELLKKHEIKDPECYSGIGDGWVPLVDRLFDDLIVLGWDKDLHQIKEKFGFLRIYVGEATPEMRNLIHAAESASSKICEDCGAQGAYRGNRSWVRTLCDSC